MKSATSNHLYTFIIDVEALPDHPNEIARNAAFARMRVFVFYRDPIGAQDVLASNLRLEKWRTINMVEAVEIEEAEVTDLADLVLLGIARRDGIGLRVHVIPAPSGDAFH